MKINHNHAFSLIEVVIAMGIFSFCIVGIVGLLPIAANSVRSSVNESNANNIAESIAGFWMVAPDEAVTTGNFTMGDFTIGNATTTPQTIYYNYDGKITNETSATLKLVYTADLFSGNNTFSVNLNFTWPPNASGNLTTSRTFNYIFTK